MQMKSNLVVKKVYELKFLSGPCQNHSMMEESMAERCHGDCSPTQKE